MATNISTSLKEEHLETLARIREGQLEGLSRPYDFKKAALSGEVRA